LKRFEDAGELGLVTRVDATESRFHFGGSSPGEDSSPRAMFNDGRVCPRRRTVTRRWR
jgi:hypothetical protein